ncbi:MAG: hemolysin family protein [Planctomycetota bacterium]|jgi:CBS domain containing-hemolysin-like protein
MGILILYIVAFIAISGLMAAVDAAILSVTRPEIEELVAHGRMGAARLRDVKKHMARSVVVVVIVTNTVNVLGPIMVSSEALKRYGPESLATITIVLTLGTILFSEIFPKALGTHYAPAIGRFAALPLQLISFMLYPLVIALAWLSRKLTRGSRPIGTERQVRALALLGRRAGHIESDEIMMIYRVFRLNDSTAADIMTPRADVVAFSEDTTIRAAAERVRSAGYSRYPIYRGSLDRVEGLVTTRDIQQALIDGQDERPVGEIARRILRFEAPQQSDKMLMVFRDEHIHLGVVTEGGRTLGIVTLEDVLEELVGEIEDEKD